MPVHGSSPTKVLPWLAWVCRAVCLTFTKSAERPRWEQDFMELFTISGQVLLLPVLSDDCQAPAPNGHVFVCQLYGDIEFLSAC